MFFAAALVLFLGSVTVALVLPDQYRLPGGNGSIPTCQGVQYPALCDQRTGFRVGLGVFGAVGAFVLAGIGLVVDRR